MVSCNPQENPSTDPLVTGSFTDTRDGKVYKTVMINNREWMSENLAYLTEIHNPEDYSYSISCYYVYNYSGTNVEEAKGTQNYKTYGVLYNWPAARQACPEGWSLPTEEEWRQMMESLGGVEEAGGKLKEKGTAHWTTPNVGATNASGFTALPGGFRNTGGVFSDFVGNDVIGNDGAWWTDTKQGASDAWRICINHNAVHVLIASGSREHGHYVRCVKD